MRKYNAIVTDTYGEETHLTIRMSSCTGKTITVVLLPYKLESLIKGSGYSLLGYYCFGMDDKTVSSLLTTREL